MLTLKRKDHALEPEDEATLEAEQKAASEYRKSKVITKIQAAKKSLKKNLSVNQKLIFTDDGDVYEKDKTTKISDEGKQYENEEEDQPGINLEKAKKVLKAEDKFDREMEKKRKKEKRLEEKRKAKEERQRAKEEEEHEGEEDEEVARVADKNIHNTPHQYSLVEGDSAIEKLVSTLKKYKEICFDTETTGLDANQASLVGLSFSVKPGEAWYVPCPEDATTTKKILAQFQSLFADSSITWIGQNCKYDLLVLKWAGIEIAGSLFDTMLAHYVIEPEGKRSMDLLSEKYLGYEPVPIEELIGKKGKGQLNMRDVEVEKVKED